MEQIANIYPLVLSGDASPAMLTWREVPTALQPVGNRACVKTEVMIIKLTEIIQQAQKMCGTPPIPLSTITADITNQSFLFLFEFGYSSRIFSSRALKATTTN